MKTMGRDRLDAVEGSGAFATVWRGFDTQLETPVAIKVLADNWSHHADVRERFLQEARLLRAVNDPRVVRVHDVGVHDDRPYFVMDHVAGGTLHDVADGRLAEDQALELAEQACRAVAALHAAGVLHRDVKPSNLLVDRRDDGSTHVLVADLGSAKRLAEASGITVTTGTPAYMSPEQALGRPIDERTDVYALGVALFVLLTGSPPFDGQNTATTAMRSTTDRPPGLSGPLDEVVARATADEADDRHLSATALADDLRTVRLGGRPASPLTPASGLPLWWLVALAVVVFGASAAATWFVLGL